MADNPRIEELRRRVLADPASIAFAALAEEYRRSGNYAEAIETCRVGLQRHPSYLSARVTLGRALMETAQYGEARRELELVLKSAPENLAAIRGLAEIHEREGSLPEPDAISPSPAARQPLSIAPAAPVESPTAASVAERAAQPVPVRQPVAIAAAPVNTATVAPAAPAAPPATAARAAAAATLDPAVAGLEQFLVAIQSARGASRISR